MTTMQPYGASAETYQAAGWWPIPVKGKALPATGATGMSGTVTAEKITDWIETNPADNVGLRLSGVIAIDVDHYGDKHGGDTLAEFEARLGALPATWRSTSRGVDSPSGQRFYRVPGDALMVKGIGGDIDVVQFSHRYSVVWPSIHPENGRAYRWITPAGNLAPDGEIPHVDFDLPDLPEAWLEELTREPEAPLAEGVDVRPWRQLTASFPTGDPCLLVSVFDDDLATAWRAPTASHHDLAMRFALRGMMLGREGHTGVAPILDRLFKEFRLYISDHPNRDQKEPDNVFRAATDTAQRKIIETACNCPRNSELTDADLVGLGVPDPNLASLLQARLLTPRMQLELEVAAAQFVAVHPVRRHLGSSSAVYMWTGDRWDVADVAEHIYRWLSATLAAQGLGSEFSGRKADELTRYILTHAPQVTDANLDRRWISVKNGLLDWRTGELKPRTRDVFVVNHLPWAWNPDARAGRFEEWVDSAIDPAATAAVWEVLGYAVSPIHDLKVALALTGPGGGGKSTFVNVVTSLVGGANVSALSPNDLGERFNPAELFGKTVNAAGDVGAETLRNLGRFKMVVAGDEIQAERKGRDPFRFRPRAFSLASFNVLPAVEQNDSAFWDRWLVLPFQHRFNRGKPDNYYRDSMPYDVKVMEGVLVGAIAGLNRLRDRGRFDPAVFGAAKEEWRAQVDGIAGFVADHITLDSSGKVDAATLFGYYQFVVDTNGGKPKGRNTMYRDFTDYLQERFPGKVLRRKESGATTFYGFKVYDDRPAPANWGERGRAVRVD